MQVTDYVGLVSKFHDKFGVHHDPEIANSSICELRLTLIQEEVKELAEALDQGDRVAIADALGDILYVTFGAALAWDLPIGQIVEEIHRSNMTKTPGNIRPDGKILKGPAYSPPNLRFVTREECK